jgi:hypothetical protein
MVVQFGNVAQYLLVPKVEAEPPPTGEVDLINGKGLLKGTVFFAKLPEVMGSDAY